MLEVHDIHTYYGDSHILHGVSLTVPAGRVVTVLGRNGMGKTTLIRSVIGFTPPRQGRITFAGVDITRARSEQIVAQGMGLVPQGRRIFPSLTVAENLTVAATRRNGDGWTLERVFGLFPRLRERQANRGNKLSGGEQQMLAIGRALMTNPKLLLMDEPTEGLAPMLVREVGRAIRALKDEGLSILLVEQSVPFALRIADHVAVLARGQVVWKGGPADLTDNDEIKSRYLGL
jgi:branched-chain amino acid transport system ATP-binding protein